MPAISLLISQSGRVRALWPESRNRCWLPCGLNGPFEEVTGFSVKPFQGFENTFSFEREGKRILEITTFLKMFPFVVNRE